MTPPPAPLPLLALLALLEELLAPPMPLDAALLELMKRSPPCPLLELPVDDEPVGPLGRPSVPSPQPIGSESKRSAAAAAGVRSRAG